MRGHYIWIAVVFWTVAARAEHTSAVQNSNGGQTGTSNGQGQGYQGSMALGGSGGGVSGGSSSYQQRSDPNATVKYGEQSDKTLADLNKANVSFAKDSSANLKELLKSAEVPEAGADFIKNGYDAIAAKETPDLTKDGDSIVNSIQTDNSIETQNILMMKNALIGPAPAKPATAAAPIPTVGDTISAFTSTRSVGSISGSGLGAGTAAEMPASRVHALASIPSSSGTVRGVTSDTATVQGAPARGIMSSVDGAYKAPPIRSLAH